MSENTKALTVTDKRKNFLAVLEGKGFKSQIGLALPKHMTPDRMLRVALTAMNKLPDLYDCDQGSIMACMMDCSALGLEPDGRNAYLIPYNDKKRGKICQLIIGYQGFIDLGYRHPLVRGIRAKAVYAKDHFVYDEGLHPKLEHTPYDGDDEPGALKFAYAICNIGDTGGCTFVVLNRRQVMKAKACGRGSDSPYSPWQQHEEAMWVKTAIRNLAKFMPKSSELAQALNVDDTHTGIDQNAMGNLIPTGSVGSNTPAIETTAAEPKTLIEQAQEETASKEALPKTEDKPPAKETGPTAEALLKTLLAKGNDVDAGKAKVKKTLIAMGMMKESEGLDQIDASRLANILDGWEAVEAELKK